MTVGALRLGYFADGPWAHRALEMVARDPSLQLAFLCVRYPQGDAHLEARARDLGVPLFKVKDVNAAEAMDGFAALGADIFVSMSFDQIFRRPIINLPRLRTINCHAGKLPFYRGRNVLNWVLINDEREFGITVHYVDEGIDTGDIILQRVFPISDEDRYETLLTRAHEGCAQVLYDALKTIQRGDIAAVPQRTIHPVGFYCGIRREGDERLDWAQPSRAIFNFVRAICPPGPAARTSLRGAPMRVLRVREIPGAPSYRGTVGEVVGRGDTGFVVKTLDSTIEVTAFEYDGKVRIGDRFE